MSNLHIAPFAAVGGGLPMGPRLSLGMGGWTIPQSASAALIGLACLALALILIRQHVRPVDFLGLPDRRTTCVVAAFLALCGFSRLLEALGISPVTRLRGTFEWGMAAGSWAAIILSRRTRGARESTDPGVLERVIRERRHAEEALQRSQDLTRKLAHVASRTDNIVIITDSGGRIEWTNQAFSRLTGYSPEEVVGRTPGSFLQGPETDPSTSLFMKQRIRNGQSFQTEVLNYSKAGRKYWLSIEVQPIRDEGGKLVNFVAVESDVTERKRSERRMEVHHATMRILAECRRLDQAIPRLLATIGRTLDFDFGEFWLVDPEAGTLRPAARFWSSPKIGRELGGEGSQDEVTAGKGLTGQVWATGEADWVLDITQESTYGPLLSDLACRGLVRSGFGFPVVAGDGVVTGVLTFYSRDALGRDEPLLQTMSTLGRQIGLFDERWRAQAELVQVNARLNALLDASTQVSIIATDTTGLITVFNPGAERLLGYDAEEMIGRASFTSLHEPAEIRDRAARLSDEFGSPIEGFETFVARARSEGHDVQEWTYIRKDGNRLSVLLAVTAVRDNEGEISGFLGIATDLTAHHQAERRFRDSEARLGRLVDANIFGVVFGDLDGNLSDANDAFLEMVGFSRAEMSRGGIPWDALIPPSAAVPLQRCRVELERRGRCTPFEIDCRCKDGRTIPILLGLALLDEERGPEGARRVVAFCLDVSERRRLEDELRRRASELAEADRRKNEFLAMLGHELRNPLAPIRNAVKILRQRAPDDPALCWARDIIGDQVRHLSQLVDDLLEISRVTRGKVRLQKELIDVATVVGYAVETSRPIIDANRHRLSISVPQETVKIEADPVRMAQVLSNLLNNSAKYTQEGGRIRLSVATEGGDVVFRVQDNGIGIPPEMLSSVFDLFTQVDHSLDRSQGGLGLGLTLVRSLVELHGGTVQASSRGLGRGSEFAVRLPAWAEPDGTTLDEPSGKPGAGSQGPRPADRLPIVQRVLVVDDNVSSARTLEMLLRYEGHEVQVVHDGPSAIEAIGHHHHGVVLMDIGLPGMSGYDVARMLRQSSEAGNPLLVAVTGYAEDEARRRSHEAGFDHHLVKPVDPDAILDLLAQLETCRGPCGTRPCTCTRLSSGTDA